MNIKVMRVGGRINICIDDKCKLFEITLDLKRFFYEIEEWIRGLDNISEYDYAYIMNEILLRFKPIYDEALKERAIHVVKDNRRYYLLASDGFRVPHTGFFLVLDDGYVVSEIFYAYTHVEAQVEKRGRIETIEYNAVKPFLLIFKYEHNGDDDPIKIIEPIEGNEIDLGGRVLQLDKKSIGEVGLPTTMTYDTVVKLKNFDVEDLISLIDLKELYTRIKEKFKENIDFVNEIYYDLVSLWCIGTYFSDIFKIYPILVIFGSSGSGKTRLTSLGIGLSRRGFLITNPTDTNIHRIIGAYRPTLGFDDFDIIMRRHKSMLVSLLKHVYKEGVLVPRLEKTKGDTFILGLFSMYAPTIINSVDRLEAGIDKSLQTQIITRYISIEMARSNKKFTPIDDPIGFWRDEREKLYIARFLYSWKIYKLYNEIETGLARRDDEIFRPILTIAKLIDDELYERIKKYAIEYSIEKEEELYEEEKLVIKAIELTFQQHALQGEIDEIMFTASELLANIKQILVEEEHEITERQFEKEWSVQRLGRILERMHIPKKRRDKKGSRMRIVSRNLLKILKARYGVSDNTDISDNNIDTSSKVQDENIQSFTEKDEKSSSEKPSDVSHIPSEMSETSVKFFECPYCGMKFGSEIDLRYHIQYEHGDKYDS